MIDTERLFDTQPKYFKCEKCNGDGFIRDEFNQVKQDNGQDIYCICYIHNEYTKANIGVNYWDITSDNYQGDPEDLRQIAKYSSKIHELKKHGIGFYIYGPEYGTGKTTVSLMLLKHILNTTNYTCLFVPFSDLVILNTKALNSSFDKAVDKKLEYIKAVDFLVIDDICKEYENGRDNGRATLNSILRNRDLWNRNTFYTSNVSLEEMTALYGGSNASIIVGRSIQITMKNTLDFRGTRNFDKLLI